ncbi:hypothetical protein CC1G_14071 [Coprinopsis cinerea okayama7|uniref:Uncharacterized protein n=1 Tax=Coprinopsis cinerea (strain Okayama-7 / 130 / ATCC MYA-4618 / FGSC 9003) TaxID=240176 RepID=D6RL44_COPC7|nr:hypothetical protein CC1G_14071 [Coprinopsis cinerea okayama7\|eukprot:XP_002911539.1 hypothetical protein CC1G_14071 [Coprinopsis cinerea okayama7\
MAKQQENACQTEGGTSTCFGGFVNQTERPGFAPSLFEVEAHHWLDTSWQSHP